MSSHPEGSPRCPLCGESGGEENVCDYCGAARRPGGHRSLAVIAQHEYSRVYRAEDAAGRPVAVKELLFSRVPGAKEIDAFEREARILASLDHPRIPKVLGHFSDGRGVHLRLCLVQEFVEGESLQKKLDGRLRFSESDAREIALQLLPVLEYLHTRAPPIVHRDLKPANIMLRPDGSYALVDFGAARDLVRGETYGSTLVGTFGYMPLEQLGGTVNPTSDLYALGMTLIHVLSGRAPADLIDHELRVNARNAVDCSPALKEWLAQITAPKREDRFESAAIALAALGAGPRVIPAAPPEREPAAKAKPPTTAKPAASPTACRGCGLEVVGFACANCEACLLPAGLRVERILSDQRSEGRTYLAREADGKQVVVREQLLAPAASEEALQLYLKRLEERFLLVVDGVARVHRFSIEGPPDDRRVFLVREHLEGPTLEELRKQGLDAWRVLAIARELFGLLRRLHLSERPALLGPLTPADVVRRRDGSCALLDLPRQTRLPKELARWEVNAPAREAWLPRELRKQRQDESTDVAALGMLLLSLRSKAPALRDKDLQALRLAKSSLGLSPTFANVLIRTMENNQGPRFLTASAVLSGLAALAPTEAEPRAPVAANPAPSSAPSSAPSRDLVRPEGPQPMLEALWAFVRRKG